MPWDRVVQMLHQGMADTQPRSSAAVSASAPAAAAEAAPAAAEERDGAADTANAPAGAPMPSAEQQEEARQHRRLLLFRPLAHLTNSVIDGFNELRKCASVSIRERVCEALAVDVIRAAYDAVSVADETHGQGASHARAALREIVKEDLVGVCARCFAGVFGPTGGRPADLLLASGIFAAEEEERQQAKQAREEAQRAEEIRQAREQEKRDHIEKAKRAYLARLDQEDAENDGGGEENDDEA